MRALPFQMKKDDLYWTRIKVFGTVYKALRGELENFNGDNQDLVKIQEFIKNELFQNEIDMKEL